MSDFSRDTFDRRHHFSRVLMQQGRVLLDADWNEQTAILLHSIRTLAADLIGRHGGPGGGFRIECRDDDGNPLNCDFRIGWGHYYVDGILCENEPPARCGIPTPPRPPAVTYMTQPDLPRRPDERPAENTKYLVYLDVWERQLTHLEAPWIREVALGGPDTAARAKVVWQVRIADESRCGCDDDAGCDELLAKATAQGPRCLRARARVDQPSDSPCVIPPESRYRGLENQLYRVEIHAPGDAAGTTRATWKWSRDNGSVIFAIRSLKGNQVTLDTLGPDERRSLREGDWVEIVDDRSVLLGEPGVLVRVDAVDRVAVRVTLTPPEGVSLPSFDERATTHPLLRRWDHGSAPIPVSEGKWVDLEDGVQVYFEPGGDYRTGDHWLIPARTETGDVHWPDEVDPTGAVVPKALTPAGIRHHYAPLGRISVDGQGNVTCEGDCRCTFTAPCERAAPPPPPPPGTPPNLLRAEAIPRTTDTCTATLPVRFIASATGTAPLQYEWHFGDGATSMGAEAFHKYAAPGVYSVKVVVTNAVGSDAGATEVTVARCQTGGGLNPIVVTPERMAPLLRIAGVGDRRAELFLAAGRGSAAEVATMTTEEVRLVLGVSETVASEIRESARRIARE